MARRLFRTGNRMSDQATMAIVLTGLAIIIICWAWYNYTLRQDQLTKEELETLVNFEFDKEYLKKRREVFEKHVEKPKKRPYVRKATTRKEKTVATKSGLYANIHAKQERIKKEKAEGKPVEKMRKPGTKGAPTAKAFAESAKTAKKK